MTDANRHAGAPGAPGEPVYAADPLRFSELMYRRLFEAAQDGILILDVADGRIAEANPYLEKLLAFTREEMVGRTVGELSPFTDIVSNQAMLERLQETGYVRYEHLPLETRDGRHIEVEFVSNVYWAGDRQVIQCNIRDITERKAAERHLALLYTCISHLNEIVMITEAEPLDEPGPKIVFLNDAFERVTGYTRAEALGRSPRFLQGEKTDPKVLEEIGRALSLCEPIRRQVIHYRKDGSPFWLDIDIVPVRDESGRCTHFIAIERDITAEKASEEELVWKTTLLEAQLDSSIDGILIVNTKGRQLLQNRRMAEMWKMPPGLFEDKDEASQLAFAMGPAKDPEAFIARIDHLYAHPEEVGRDQIELLDGTVLDRYSASIGDRAGHHYGRIWSFRDITERCKMEALFREAHKMEAIGQLAGGIAHDFNNILTAIVGNLDLAVAEANGNAVLAECLGEISKAAGRATDLVKKILTFSRGNSPELEAMALDEVVPDALKLLRASLPATIQIRTEVSPTPPVLTQATAIHQVIMNLGTNAWHAIGDGSGTLTVGVGVVEVGDELVLRQRGLVAGPHVCLSFADTGCGMDATTVERIFDPFYTTKPMGKGTGLGLAVVQGIMKSHHGAITVHSRPGEGTVFRLYFPIPQGEIR